MQRCAICVVVLSCLLWSGGASADRDTIQLGLAAYEALDYERAVALLHQAFSESLGAAEKRTVLSTLAFAHVALNQDDQARAAFRLLLRSDPTTSLDETISPRTRLLFEEARSDLGPAAPAALSAAIDPASPVSGRPLVVSALAPGAASAQLFYRSVGQSSFHRVGALAEDGRIAISVPATDVKAPALEYYLLALDAVDQVKAQAGSQERWLRADVAAPRVPLYRRGWVWGTAAGATAAVVVVGVVAGLFAQPSTARVTIAHP
jgi:hypothetical protein